MEVGLTGAQVRAIHELQAATGDGRSVYVGRMDLGLIAARIHIEGEYVTVVFDRSGKEVHRT